MYRLLTIISVFIFTGCEELHQIGEQTRSWMHEERCVRVLCTTEYVSSLVSAVGGDQIVVCTLIPSQNDPHSYQLVKGDDAKFRRANLIFYSGLNLEQGAIVERYLKRYSAHAIGDYIQGRTQQAIITDPHMWNDLHLWSYGLFLIADELSKIRPDTADYFQKNAAAAFEKYQRMHEQFRRKMQAIDEKRRYFVTTHDAFSYFCRAYVATDEENRGEGWRKRSMAPEGFSPESQISTKDIQKVVDYVVEHNIHTVFSEIGVNQDSIQKVVDICKEKGCNVVLSQGSVYSDALGPKISYEGAMKHNIDIVAASFMEN